MPYATGRVYHDADSHVMETDNWLVEHADPAFRDRIAPFDTRSGIGGGEQVDWAALTCPLHNDPAYRAAEDQVLLRKNFHAVGSFERDHRSEALDQLGFASQLVFNTFASTPLQKVEHGDDLDRAAEQARRALELGAKALMIASACPRHHAPSHVGLDAVWAQAQEARVPIVMHVGGGGELLSPRYFDNGLPPVPDFHGGAENFRSVDYMAIPYNPMQTMSALILDGVLDRFPDLKWGIIEQGASWVPGWMRNLDAAFGAFRKNEERLQRLSLKPSGFVQRQVRVTPYPHEDAGWIIRNSGPDICLFSSDYPHVEGGRNPLKRFGESLQGCTQQEVENFYCHNMEDLMGPHIPAPVAQG